MHFCSDDQRFYKMTKNLLFAIDNAMVPVLQLTLKCAKKRNVSKI